MSNTKHTPGPWEVERCKCGQDKCNTHGTSNGHFYQGTGYSLADAKLIAAAPELLKACKLILTDALMALDGSWDRSDSGFQAQIDLLETTINKATL